MRRLILGLALSLLVACALNHEGPTITDSPVPLTVQNDGWLDVSVSVYHGGQFLRIGFVRAVSTATFQIPASVFAGERRVRLFAHRIGGADTMTDWLAVQDGQIIEWRLGNVPDHDAASVL